MYLAEKSVNQTSCENFFFFFMKYTDSISANYKCMHLIICPVKKLDNNILAAYLLIVSSIIEKIYMPLKVPMSLYD